MPTYVANLIIGADLPTLGILLVMMLIFLFMGAFMDCVGVLLLVMPVFLPIVLKLPVEEIGIFGPMVDGTTFMLCRRAPGIRDLHVTANLLY